MAANIIVHQQVAAPAMKAWNTGLFDCCQDMNSCCYGFWCCPCLACSTTGEFGESTCLPLVDIIGPACMVAFGVPIIVPPASLSMRVAVRHKYGIQQSLCEDIMASCFCVWCSWCQMAREIKDHKKSCTFTTTQPVAIQVQPPTMTNSNVSYTTNQQSYTMTSPQSPNQQGYIMTNSQGYTMTSPQSPNQQGYIMTNQQGYIMTSPQSPNQQGYIMTSPQSPNQQGYIMTSPQSSSMVEKHPDMMAGPPGIAGGAQIKMASDQHAMAGPSQMMASVPNAYNPAFMMPPDMSNHMVNTTVSTQPSKC
uniref:DNA-directed RNA polymerase II subunit RPB1-like n=1 Tax=Oncorhynchus gorbuscha TaxID=8017 RepID=UPI001EAF0284|nr:DNA-directed RNA polymerase II subunit RPB1-like [Oncorhynchus gorbuscha]